MPPKVTDTDISEKNVSKILPQGHSANESDRLCVSCSCSVRQNKIALLGNMAGRRMTFHGQP